ncbi:TetR/AcrR family transcriptional regulator [Marinicella rhabdoformis]|uniref:TetR/AcrR family transcriptional regulator n=1 Tax=Marinicella rhabdoformis TaxID=2580566 RepID=UPI0012AEC451|nr:TetR/AcrR family transcriptional regulator [Marinicella rhabdoformis]
MINGENDSQLAWLKMGIYTLDQLGFRALKIKDMCERLKVTKGSFYHWFKSKREYELQLLNYWKQRYTQGFIKNAEKGKNCKKKLAILGEQCIEGALNGNRLEFEINAWSLQDEKVKSFVTSVYEQRHQYLIKLLSGIYKDPVEVKKHALILYALVVGIDCFYRELTREELDLMFSDYLH